MKHLYTPEGLKLVENINFYLVSALNVSAELRTNPISRDAPAMMGGNRVADGGNLIIEAEDYEEFIMRCTTLNHKDISSVTLWAMSLSTT